MDFSLSDDQRLIAETARRFVVEELIPLEDEIEETDALDDGKARAIIAKSRAIGLYAANIPEAFGGGGLSALDNTLIEEEFGRTADILCRRGTGNVYDLLLACQGAQRQRWLLPAVRGERVACFCFTEPGAGSDAAAIRTRARRDGGGWVLDGQKHFISDGLFADFCIVSAITDPEKGARGISLFLVDKGTPGFTLGRSQDMMGMRGTPHVELWFDSVRLDEENLLGGEGEGLKLALDALGRIRIMHIGARAVGKATRIFAMMVDYARERRQFGRPIGDFQMVQQMLADSAIEIETTRQMVRWTAAMVDAGHDPRLQISMLKVQAAEMLGRVADRGVQIFGGMGYCKDLKIEKFYRDARIYRIYDGTSEIHRMVIARGLMKDGPGLVDPSR